MSCSVHFLVSRGSEYNPNGGSCRQSAKPYNWELSVMGRLIVDGAKENRAALYNEISHMTPYYWTMADSAGIDVHKETIFHIRNIKLLSLYFDRIFIPIENLLAFANSRNMRVVQSVSSNKEFRELIDLGIVSLCGWGGTSQAALIEKGVKYATKDYEELKSNKHIQQIEFICNANSLYTRESTSFDFGHDQYILDILGLIESGPNTHFISSAMDFVREFYKSRGFIGSMEFYRWIDSNKIDQETRRTLYFSYYRAWQEYCYENYAPVVTINSERIKYSHGFINVGTKGNIKKIHAELYSPIIFYRFLAWQLGEKVARKVLRLKPIELKYLRNGDGAWRKFQDTYHKSIEASSSLYMIELDGPCSGAFFTDSIINSMLPVLFDGNSDKYDYEFMMQLFSALAEPAAWAAQFFNPTTLLFTFLSKLYRKGRATPFAKEVVPFYKKVTTMIETVDVRHAL